MDQCSPTPCAGDRIPESFTIFYKPANNAVEKNKTVLYKFKNPSTELLEDLDPNTMYNISIKTKIKNGGKNKFVFSDRSENQSEITGSC